jgi:thiol:disulfide interchange protein
MTQRNKRVWWGRIVPMTSGVELLRTTRIPGVGINGLLRKTVLLAGALALTLPAAGCQQDPSPAPETLATNTPVVPAPPPPVPFIKRHIYSETANPRVDIAAALKQAAKEHKRVIIDFGGDWCPDCQVLDIYFRQSPNDELLEKNFVLVHVFVNSEISNNLDLGEKYGIPLKKGVPALAVLDAKGKILYSQKTGEFERMSHMDAKSVTDFLNRWKS